MVWFQNEESRILRYSTEGVDGKHVSLFGVRVAFMCFYFFSFLFFFFCFCFSECKVIDTMMIVKMFIVFAICGVVGNACQNVTMARRAFIECCPHRVKIWENGKLVGVETKSEFCPEKKEEERSNGGNNVNWSCGGFVFMVMRSLIL